MIYRFIQKKTLAPFATLPFIMIALWSKALFYPTSDVVVSSVPMPLFELTHKLLTGHNFLSSLMSLFLAFIVMFGLNRINTKHQLLKHQNLMPGLIFLIFVSGYPLVQQMLEIWFFLPFFVFAIDRLFIATSKRDSSTEIFNALFLVSTGSLFFGKGLFFVPLIIWSLLLLNIIELRGFFAAILGLIVPYFFAFGAYIFLSRELEFFGNIYENIASAVALFSHNIFSKIYNGILVALIIISILLMVRMLNTLKIVTRKYLRVLILIVFYGIVLAATPFYSIEIIPVIGIGGAIVIANFFDNIRSAFYKELFFTLFVVVTITIQLLN